MATFDFIVVGAGASGCALASRLASTAAKPSVLLVEAGGANQSAADLSGAERYNVAFAPVSLLNWNYKTTKQAQLAGQRIDYSRGKGLGGSTAINFCAWTLGPRDDFDELARAVQDQRFNWASLQRCFRRIEKLHSAIPDPKLRGFVDAAAGGHSNSGALDLTYGESWLPNIADIFTAAAQAGLPLNKDVNDGNPIGMGMGPVCILNGRRLTAVDAYIKDAPVNLIVTSAAPVAKVLFSGRKAVGVETVDGRQFRARREVILSGGAVNTPQILMLSGIGPAAELRRHGIEPILDLPAVGQNLQDHCFSSVGVVIENPEAVAGTSQSPAPMGWFKIPSLASSNEYDLLPGEVRRHREKTTVPDVEVATHSPPSFVGHEHTVGTEFLGAICLLMNPQSRGSVTLRSSDPMEAPVIDPKFLCHAFDRRALIEGMRLTQSILSSPIYAEKTVKTYFPANQSDEAIWEYIRHTTRSSWHMSGTVKMGTSGLDACVNSSFRVFGLQSLRVVDMSVMPFVPNCHTQSTAYLLGEVAAEVLTEDHFLSMPTGSAKAML